jgi:hypothetical protein
LAYEFDVTEYRETERKIKRRLKYYELEDYNQERIDYIRKLKNDLKGEIDLGAQSKYFEKSISELTDLKDYQLENMKSDFLKKYHLINEKDIEAILNFAIYLYYLR